MTDEARYSRRGFLRRWSASGDGRSKEGADESLAQLTIAEAGRHMAARDLSPFELMQHVLWRIERLEPAIGAFRAHMNPEWCLEAARQAELEIGEGRYRGKLHGIPIAVKDTHYTRALPTTAGSPILDGFRPDFDATVVRKLEEAGAIIIGKTNLPEWSFGGATPGTHNPWDLATDPGGSSGGSAAAVAAGLVLGATGGDTSGSIRSPAMMCGVVGLKATFGRVSCHGVVPISWTLDHVGPIAKTVEDAAVLLSGMAGHDPRDPNSAPVPTPVFTARLRRGVRGWTIGRPPDSLIEAQAPEIRAAFASAISVFEALGATVREVPLPATFAAAQASQRIIRIAEAAAYHRQYLVLRPEMYGSGTVRRQVLAGSLIPAAAYQRAQQVRRAFIRDLWAMFEPLDVYITPGWRSAADPSGFPSGPVQSGMFNLSGFPAIVLPAGFTDEAHPLPVGVQIAGRPFEEDVVLAAAQAYEQATDWHTRRPPL